MRTTVTPIYWPMQVFLGMTMVILIITVTVCLNKKIMGNCKINYSFAVLRYVFVIGHSSDYPERKPYPLPVVSLCHGSTSCI